MNILVLVKCIQITNTFSVLEREGLESCDAITGRMSVQKYDKL